MIERSLKVSFFLDNLEGEAIEGFHGVEVPRIGETIDFDFSPYDKDLWASATPADSKPSAVTQSLSAIL